MTSPAPQTSVAAPTPGAATTALPQGLARPMTLEDVRLLQNRRSELSRQLRSATDRRSEVVRDMGRSANGREGLEARLKVLDERIVQLERDISQNGQLLASAPPNLVEQTTPAPPFTRNGNAVDLNAISIIFTLGVLMPLAIAYARRILRRPMPPTPILTESVERLARLENAIDSIALEVERISEGQRFVTKLLSEHKMLGAGAAQPIVMAAPEKIEVERPR